MARVLSSRDLTSRAPMADLAMSPQLTQDQAESIGLMKEDDNTVMFFKFLKGTFRLDFEFIRLSLNCAVGIKIFMGL